MNEVWKCFIRPMESSSSPRNIKVRKIAYFIAANMDVPCKLLYQKMDITLYIILPRLLQRSKECRGLYSTLYHATSQWIMRSDFFWHNVKNPCIWSSKSCQLHVDFTYQIWCWPCWFRTSMYEINCSRRVDCTKLSSLC